ncbi:MAG TPA: hypothetical protein VME47_14765 [Acetobacteraceae bacterium]|nr:hypothetical protein [Acetobacteraceae bacterium]
MAQIGLAEASRLTGKNQSTIHRAMKSGRLSYTVGDAGERLIDPAELARVFAVNPGGEARNAAPPVASNGMQLAELRVQVELTQARLADKDAMIAELREDRDHWRKQAEMLLLTDGRARPPRKWWPFGTR